MNKRTIIIIIIVIIIIVIIIITIKVLITCLLRHMNFYLVFCYLAEELLVEKLSIHIS